jgi:Flp pilus assembly protein TadG
MTEISYAGYRKLPAGPRRWLRLTHRTPDRPGINDAAHGESGGSMIEFALSFSALMTFVFCLMEMCVALYSYGLISESARETTRYAIVHGSTCLTSSSTSCTASATTINTYAKNLGLPNIGGGTLNVTTTFPDGTNVPGNRVNVSIQYTMPIKMPFVPRSSLSMTSASQMYILQ